MGIEQRSQAWPRRVPPEVGLQIGLERPLVLERPPLGVLLDEKVEGIERGQLRDQVHRHDELPYPVGEDDARLPVPERILLPIDEVVRGLHLQRIGEDPGPRVGGGPQPNDLRGHGHQPVVPVAGAMVECDLHAHGEARRRCAQDSRRANAVRVGSK